MNQKEQFIRNEILSATINAAFQHAGVYKKEDVTEEQKEEFRRIVKTRLIGLTGNDSRKNDHLQRIREFKNSIEDTEYRSILRNGQVSFGVAQKLVNLYLKYLWCLGKSDKPPHCPIDADILKKGRAEKFGPWTKMDERKYESAIKKIKEAINSEDLATWELKEWNVINLFAPVS